jgi:hypothetical protein
MFWSEWNNSIFFMMISKGRPKYRLVADFCNSLRFMVVPMSWVDLLFGDSV